MIAKTDSLVLRDKWRFVWPSVNGSMIIALEAIGYSQTHTPRTYLVRFGYYAFLTTTATVFSFMIIHAPMIRIKVEGDKITNVTWFRTSHLSANDVSAVDEGMLANSDLFHTFDLVLKDDEWRFEPWGSPHEDPVPRFWNLRLHWSSPDRMQHEDHHVIRGIDPDSSGCDRILARGD
jgi:hypothetical protein